MITQSCFQPNRFFCVRGDITGLNTELLFTKVILSVHDYTSQNLKADDIIIYFKGDAKKDADAMIENGKTISVWGDIVVKNNVIYLNGKIVEVFSNANLGIAKENKVTYISPEDIGYDPAF